ncbi:MAG: class I SAM-dependent methyltransferase [Pseudomonadota bacterium]
MSLNYPWIAKKVASLAGPEARVLDFGCGQGHTVALVKEHTPTINISGADTYAEGYARWHDEQNPGAAPAIVKIEDGKLPFADNTFDLVYANQVFEHVFEPQQALSEIGRVLKPGGIFLALFPCKGTWFEGHVGLYFVHWLMGRPNALRSALRFGHRTGAGYCRGEMTRDEWVQWAAYTLETSCIYHTWSEYSGWLHQYVGPKIAHHEHENIAFRIEQSRLNSLAGVAKLFPLKALSTLVHRLRGGRIFTVQAQ